MRSALATAVPQKALAPENKMKHPITPLARPASLNMGPVGIGAGAIVGAEDEPNPSLLLSESGLSSLNEAAPPPKVPNP